MGMLRNLEKSINSLDWISKPASLFSYMDPYRRPFVFMGELPCVRNKYAFMVQERLIHL